jgi:predicted aspartyl protease
MVGVSQARRNALAASKQAAPPVVQIQAMLDTGASGTCVDPSVLKQLGLSPTGIALVHTPSTGGQPAQAETYDISLVIPAKPGQLHLINHTVSVIASQLLANQGFHALIGLDILKGCLLTYDGANGLFSLAY